MFMKKKKKKRRKGKSASPAKKKTVSATSGGEKVPLSSSQVQGSLSPPPPTSSSSSYFTSGVNTMPVLSAAARSPPVAAFTPLLPTTATRFENLSSPTSLQAAKKNSSVVVKGGSDALYGDVIAVSVLGSTAAKTLLRVPSDEALLTLGNNNNNNHQSNISPFSADPSPVHPPYMANDGLQFATTTSPSRSPDVDRRLIEEAAALVRSGMLEEEQQRTARSGKNTPAGGNSLSITPPSGLVALPQPTTVALQQNDAPSGKHSASLPVTVASADAYAQQQRSPICDILTFPPNQSFITVVTAPDDTAVASHFWTDDSMRGVQVPWVHLSPSLPEMEALLPLPPPYMPRLDAFEIPVQMPSTQTTGRRHTTSSATSLSHFKQNSLDRRESSSVMSTVRQHPSFSVDANERDDEGDDDVAKYLPNSLRSLQLFSWDRGVAFHKQHENLQVMSSSMRPAGRVLSAGPRQPLRRPTSAQEVRRSGSVTEPSVAHDASYGRAPHAETLFGAREFSSSLPTVGFPAQALRKQHKKRV
ncbi:Hypothetical protein, putative [Bodo saltans]|uniref:Uncharacterized protein n=1 Tax=Bodo saltans TaxID=75058 RepID=A0A0S4JLT4_BODSA|nr:Hypothetical protein, putative [Bodo saltans]|eukprot:CUG90220.1 Hypothetical protein, putative [Bodo saltans]